MGVVANQNKKRPLIGSHYCPPASSSWLLNTDPLLLQVAGYCLVLVTSTLHCPLSGYYLLSAGCSPLAVATVLVFTTVAGPPVADG